MLSATAPAQPLQVFSEFARIDAAGKVTAPESPREILSPAIGRNAYSSFQVVVEASAEKEWWLHIGQNPEDAVRVTMYRESGDKLEPVPLPVHSKGTQVLWMDLWAERSAPVERIKVEPQLNIDDDWVIYPMEVRVMEATVPDGARPAGIAAPVEVMRQFACPGGVIESGIVPNDASVAKMRYRNAQQDLALARNASRGDLTKLLGACNAPPPPNPEWYYKIRDYLLKPR